jgi:hypothetical protein
MSSHVAADGCLKDAPAAGRWMLRRWLGPALWACLYVALAMMALGANPSRGETVGPFDLLATHAGWNPTGQPIEVRHRERSDIVDALLPNWLEARRQLRDGTVPLWNPLAAGGSPGILGPTKAELTVAFAIFAAAPDPALGFYFAVVATMAIGALGMHLLVAQRRSSAAALLAGSGFMLSGFVTAWLYWPHVHTAIWIPWLLLGVHWFVDRGRLRGVYGIVLATALMILGGFPFVAAIGLGAALVYAAVAAARFTAGPALRRVASVFAALLLGLMLVAIPVLTLANTVGAANLGHRLGGSPFDLSYARLLLLPWAAESPRVESHMYVGMAAIALSVFALWPIVRRRADAAAWAGLAFVAVGGMLTFGLLPSEIGRKLPVLANNPWNRSIVLLDIGLLMLAATGLDQLRAWVGGRWNGLLLAAAIIAAQWVDLTNQFEKFNGPVPTSYFYSVDPEVEELAARLPPFQYIAQDHRYFIASGTLTALGLGDWFAHSLRSPGLEGLLDSLADNPFTTRTATAIRIRQYAWESGIADAAALCYAIHGPDQSARPVLLQAGGHERVALGPINNQLVRQPIELSAPLSVSAIALRVATYRTVDLDGTLQLAIRSANGRRLMARAAVPAADARDNERLSFEFPRAVDLPAGRYELELLYAPGPKNMNLTVWVLVDGGGEVYRGEEARPGRIEYVFYDAAPGGLATHVVGKRASISVNPGCAPGAYWSEDVTGAYSPEHAGRVRLLRYRPDRFRLEVDSAEAGAVVVPMQHARGWTARVDGRPVPIMLAHGVMPAVPVPAGRVRVDFRYEPPHWRIGAVLSGLAIIVLVWLGIAKRRRKGTARAPSDRS